MEGKWEVLFEEPENEFTNYGIRDASGTLFTVLSDKEKAFQIVREHNAHAGLVEVADRYRSMAFQVFFGCTNDNDPREQECGFEWKGELARIDAALSAARGE